MARVLVVEDDLSIADLVALYLRKAEHEVHVSSDGLEALDRFSSAGPFDLVLLDLMLPGLDGRGVARRLRLISDVPIVMLTALDDDRDKIEGLDLGADDYLTKPFNPDELVARVRAILRRATRNALSPTTNASTSIEIGNVRLDTASRRVFVGGTELVLRTKEFDLLEALGTHPHVVLNREQLLDLVWGGEFDGDTRTVDVHVSRLRDRLATGGADIAIETVRSIGYRLVMGR